MIQAPATIFHPAWTHKGTTLQELRLPLTSDAVNLVIARRHRIHQYQQHTQACRSFKYPKTLWLTCSVLLVITGLTVEVSLKTHSIMFGITVMGVAFQAVTSVACLMSGVRLS